MLKKRDSLTLSGYGDLFKNCSYRVIDTFRGIDYIFITLSYIPEKSSPLFSYDKFLSFKSPSYLNSQVEFTSLCSCNILQGYLSECIYDYVDFKEQKIRLRCKEIIIFSKFKFTNENN